MPAEQILEIYPYLNPEDIAYGVLYCTFWVLHRMCRYVEVRHINRNKSSRYLIECTVPCPPFRIGAVGKVTPFILLLYHEDRMKTFLQHIVV